MDRVITVHTLRVAQPAVNVVISLANVLLVFCGRSRRDRNVRENDEATPFVVRREVIPRHHLLLVLASIIITFLVSGGLIVTRAVIPPKVWTPDLPLWHGCEWQAIGNVVSWSLLVCLCYIHDTERRRIALSRLTFVLTLLVAWTSDITLLLLSLGLQNVRHIPNLSKWSWAQEAIVAVRVLLLFPLLIPAYLKLYRHVSFSTPRNSECLGEEGVHATETDTLVPSGQGSSYGTLPSSSRLAPSNSVTPAHTPKNGKASSSPHNTANASMGYTDAPKQPSPGMIGFSKRIWVLFPYLWPHKDFRLQGLVVICLLLLALGRVVNLLSPLALGRIVDDLSAGRPPWISIFFFSGLKLLQDSGGILAVLQNLAWIPVEQYSDRRMSMMAFEHLLNLSLAFHTKRKTGEVLRILDRGSAINSFFQYLLFNLVPVFVDIFVAMVYMGRTFGIGVGVLLFVVMYLYTYCSVKLTTWRAELRRAANNKDSLARAIHADTLLNYETVKCYSNEGYELERYHLALADYQQEEYKVLASLNLLNFCQNFIIAFGTLSTTLLVAENVVRGTLSSSQFVVFISYLQQIYRPLSMLGTLWRVINQNLVDTDKLMALLEESTDIKDQPDAKDLVVTDGVIEFRDVYFSYDGQVNALNGLSFKLDPRSSCALVGESGAGKSSILRLLYRFYDPQRGCILIDGQDISTVTQSSLRRAIGIVPQEPSLFNTDIRHNILYGDTSASDEAVVAAALAAQIYDRIMGFPEGMQTVVGERGVRLSGGEKQRVAIARTILKNPPLLLLDEATSALDSQTERQLQGALGNLMQGRTSLTIAHRLSTIMNVNTIIVLDAGRVVERGSHFDLVSRDGIYAAMWESQVNASDTPELSSRKSIERGKELVNQIHSKLNNGLPS